MRIAVISDIHGNALAFEKVIAEIKREAFDQVVCLGDAVQGGPQPAETVALLRDLGWPVVMGNADEWLLSGVETGRDPIPDSRLRKLQRIREWSLSRLSAADRAFIAAFRQIVEIPLDSGRNLLCFHGSPGSFDDILLPTTSEAEFQSHLAPYLPNIMCGGHTHLPHIRRIGSSDSFYFNPGSVGLAYSHEQSGDRFRTDSWAEYAILTADRGRFALEFRRVPYEPVAIIEVYRSSGRPYANESIAQYGALGM